MKLKGEMKKKKKECGCYDTDHPCETEKKRKKKLYT